MAETPVKPQGPVTTGARDPAVMPREFADRVAVCARSGLHVVELMLETLESIGYGEGVTIARPALARWIADDDKLTAAEATAAAARLQLSEAPNG